MHHHGKIGIDNFFFVNNLVGAYMLRHWSCDCVAKMLLLPFVWTNDGSRDTTEVIQISGRKLQTYKIKSQNFTST